MKSSNAVVAGLASSTALLAGLTVTVTELPNVRLRPAQPAKGT